MALPILGVLALDALLVAVVFTVAGLASTWALLRGFHSRWVVFAGTLGAVLFVAACFFSTQTGASDSVTQWQNLFETWFAAQSPALLKSGLTPETIDLLKTITLKYFFFSMPAWIAVGCLIAGLVSYYLASALLLRITVRVERPLAFRFWVLPEFSIFGLIIACLLKLKLFTTENSFGDLVGDNLLVFFIGFYALGGLSIVSFYFHKWRLPVFWRIVSYFMMFQFFLQAAALVACLGILDVWFDSRKLKSIPSEEKNP
jgi:uncharacterized protein YybS (DUF2232 family)